MIADTFLNRDRDFWNELQTYCFAECCGIDAFDFSDENLIETIQFYNAVLIIKNLEELIIFLQEKKSNTISIYLWNHCENRNELINRIKKIKRVLLSVSV